MACICNELRKTARLVTEVYDRALAPAGLKLNQYSLMTNLNRLGEAPVTELGRVLELDQTSTSRSVAALESLGFVERVEHQDTRVKLLRLTRNGKAKLKAAVPLWQAAQDEMQEKVPEKQLEAMLEALMKMRGA